MLKPMCSKLVFVRVRSGPCSSLASDKTHCKPSDEVKTNQWVCALALLPNRKSVQLRMKLFLVLVRLFKTGKLKSVWVWK